MRSGDIDNCSNVLRSGSFIAIDVDHQSLTDCLQDVFVIRDGGPGALDELERRKFTAEEGVSLSSQTRCPC